MNEKKAKKQKLNDMIKEELLELLTSFFENKVWGLHLIRKFEKLTIFQIPTKLLSKIIISKLT